MKAKCPPVFTQAQKQAMENEIDKYVSLYSDMNFKVTLITLIERYGFGKKRIQEFIQKYDEVMAKFKDHDRDGVFELRFDEVWESVGLEKSDYVYDYISPKERNRQEKVRNKVNFVEGLRIQQKLKEFKDFEEGLKNEKSKLV